jgi:hypothetical protein
MRLDHQVDQVVVTGQAELSSYRCVDAEPRTVLLHVNFKFGDHQQ